MRELIKEIQVSNRMFKKYKAVVQDKKSKIYRSIHFGDKRYEQYKDSTNSKHFANKNHSDKKRRKLYYLRHSGESSKTKAIEKETTKSKGFFNPKILSHKFLW